MKTTWLWLTDPEFDTVLAALRCYQCCVDRGDKLAGEVFEIATNSGEHEALDAEQIDLLCEALNMRNRAVRV